MIPNIAESAVKLSRLAANELEYKQFMKRRHNRLLYYNAETDDLTKRWFAENLLKNVPIGNINITKRVIDRTSEVYMVEAKRFFDADPPTVRYNEHIPKKHERMQRIERMTNLLDVVAIHPFWNDKTKIIDHSILIEFQPWFDKYGDMIGIRYPLAQSTNTDSTDEQTFVEWDLNGWRIIDVNGIQKQTESVTGPFPFVLAWTEQPQHFYNHNPTEDLAQGNLCINFYQTALNANVGYQSFGQPYVTGLQADQEIEWGIDKVPALPEGAAAGILSPPSTVSDVTKAQSQLYKHIARAYHLPEDLVEGSAQAESGIAIKLRNQELQNERVGDVARWRNVETEVYVIERDILSRVGVSLPDTLMVDFSESVEFLSPQEQREQDDWNLSHNLITPVDIAMRNNPDLDEKQAEELITNNATSAGVIKKAENGRSTIVDDILGIDNG